MTCGDCKYQEHMATKGEWRKTLGMMRHVGCGVFHALYVSRTVQTSLDFFIRIATFLKLAGVNVRRRVHRHPAQTPALPSFRPTRAARSLLQSLRHTR